MRTIRAKGQWPKLDILYAAVTMAKLAGVARPHRTAWDSFCLARDAGWFEVLSVSPMRTPARGEQNRIAGLDPDFPEKEPPNFHKLRQVSRDIIRSKYALDKNRPSRH